MDILINATIGVDVLLGLAEMRYRRSLRRKSRHAKYLRDEDLPLKCLHCGRGYKVRSSLSKHLKYECGGRRNFACDFCDCSYTQNMNLRRHLMHVHNVYRPPKMPRSKIL